MRCRLYLITPPQFELEAFSAALRDALSGGDVACVQLRLKDLDDADVLRVGAALKPIAQDAGAAFLINDRPDLAAKLDADGVHVGQQDATYAEARVLMGRDRIVGATGPRAPLIQARARSGLSARRSTLPFRVRGKSPTKCTARGALYAAMCSRAHAMSASAVSVAPDRTTT